LASIKIIFFNFIINNEVKPLANHKSAVKRAKQGEIKRLKNMGYKSRMKKAVKEVRLAVIDNSVDKASEELRKAVAIIQKNASKGVIHRKKASRKISRLARHINKIQSA